MTALHRKLRRDLWHAWPQVLSITSVLAAGIASLVALQGTMYGLQRARATLYQATGFADAEVRVPRASQSRIGVLATLPGVRSAESRIVMPVTIPVPGDPMPPYGVVVSLPPAAPDAHNRIIVVQGRLPERGGEALLLAKYATRYGIGPGDPLTVIARGSRRDLRITGIATSAEFVVASMSSGGVGGDEDRFAVIWAPREDVASMADLDGAFNSALFTLDGTRPWPEVQAAIDRVLEASGGLGAVERDHQASDEVLRGEFAQLRGLATVLPIIFLGVAAFLVNVVVSRMIALQRPEIAALAALGYSRRAIAAHYLQFVSVIAMLGIAAGMAGGALLGDALVGIYSEYFNLPGVTVQLSGAVVVSAVLMALGACVSGVASSLATVLRLAPAEAMRPPAPATYRALLVDRFPPFRALSPTVRMVARDLERQPARALMSIAGLAAAVGILVAGRFNNDAIPALLHIQFGLASREDVSVSFLDPIAPGTLVGLRSLPGVMQVEGFRAVPVRMRTGSVVRDVAIIAYDANAGLRRLVDMRSRPHVMPARGIMLSRALADRMDLTVGDTVSAEVREGRRRTLALEVTAIVDDIIGVQAYADPRVLAQWLGEDRVYSAAVLKVDPHAIDALQRRLGEMGTVTGFTTRAVVVKKFRDMMARTTGTMTLIETIFAAIIAAGLVYNSARVALSTRGRDLATLRVLGFTRGETSTMLLGEQAFFVCASLLPGLLLGRWFVRLLMATIDVERVRIPPIVSAGTDAFAVAVVLGTAALSAWLIHRKTIGLDLIAVLKTRE